MFPDGLPCLKLDRDSLATSFRIPTRIHVGLSVSTTSLNVLSKHNLKIVLVLLRWSRKTSFRDIMMVSLRAGGVEEEGPRALAVLSHQGSSQAVPLKCWCTRAPAGCGEPHTLKS